MEKKKDLKINSCFEKGNKCISCGICTANCDFLEKYGLDFSKEKELDGLSYHCFLCGKCTEVCPHGVDGRSIMLCLRQEKVKENKGKVKGYSLLRMEKGDYLFKNYSHGKGKSVFFPGCNYPSFYPETTKKLMGILEEKGIGTVFDCCGKPIAELGMEANEKRILEGLNERFKEKGIEEVVTACPNCYFFLRNRIGVRMVTIYEKLQELGIGEKINVPEMKLFLPCPDRKYRSWLKWMTPYLPEDVHFLTSTQCCGAGGSASVKEPEMAKGFTHKVEEEAGGTFYVYCGTCAGTFTRQGAKDVHHILTEILGSKETPKVKESLTNRMKTKFI